MNALKKLIVNADDYGICREVNTAVEQLAMTGILGGASVLANGEYKAQAVAFLRDHPDLSAGVHLNAVEGWPVSAAPQVRSLTGEDGSFVGIQGLIQRWILSPIAVSRAIEIEWRAQIERLMKSLVQLTHADSHQHLHALPPAYRCAVRLCQEYGIPALRWPGEYPHPNVRRSNSFALRASLAVSRLVAPRTPLRQNDHFLGFERVGAYGIAELIEDLQSIPDGLTEVAFHPSIQDGVPYAKLCGDRERKALLEGSFLDQIKRLGIELTTWRMVTQ